MNASVKPAFPPAFPPVETLVPHAAPMLLIDRVLNADAESLTAEVRITKNSLFFPPTHGVPAYVGIEYIAQSVAAYSGWRAQSAAPGTAPKIGYLLGTRKMTMACDGFADGDALSIHVQNIFEDGEMGVFDGEVRKGDEILVSARINVYQPDDAATPSETPTSNQETTKP
ncbi:MAG: 3-hydroxydecanoyl-ACP dehydratase [Thalassospira sp.]|nr:3-hydroxydecanoyl-ACP dehydratase [Thalassospira sp.]